MVQNRGGRPSKLTPELQAEILKWIDSGNYIETAAALAGVSKQAVFGWLRRGKNERNGKHRRFLDAVRRAQAASESRMLLYIEKAAARDWKAAAWRLEHMKPRRYAQRQRIEHTGRKGGPIVTMARMTDEELEAIARGEK